ncbi:hypothetical protein DPMN_153880 [Dreissena polymorpha]|uniref:Uncharacterized protein n=1 Tax=Dreissena polymorpha TaxID=45954 RepID=A0A9D4FMD4_DREPO|nr:hypothetical protein DPMN_153880 [Dreissena polymorpha]
MLFQRLLCCPDGHVLIAYNINNKVKLLGQVVSHRDAGWYHRGRCQITSSDIAVTVDEGEIH